MCNSVVVYGLGGEKDDFKILSWYVVYYRDFGIETLRYVANKMVYEMPMIERVYVVDNSMEVKLMFRKMLRSPEDLITFRDYIQKRGLEIPV